MHKKKFRLIYLAFLIFLSASFTTAAETYCVQASVTDINPSSIDLGEEFTVGIQIENCGSKIPDFVSFEILNPPEGITIKEPLVVAVPDLYYGNSERFLTYHLKVDDDATPGEYTIRTKLYYGEKDYSLIKDLNIVFTIIGEKAEIGIASIKTLPILPYKGDTVEMTLRIENVGKGDAKSIRVYVNHSFDGIKQTFIGKLASDEDGPAVFTFIADKYGEFEFPVTIFYYDDFGEKEFNSKIDMTILEKETNIELILFISITCFIILIGTIYFIRMKKAKDKIIHQLLKGNGLKKKGKK